MSGRQSKQSEILHELTEQSGSYAQKATLLSGLLLQAEAFLNEMPGKVVISTETSQDGISLSFVKRANGWCLILGYIYDGELKEVRATQAGIRMKAEAAKLLPELYRLLLLDLNEVQSEIDRGLESLKTLPFLDCEEAGQGEDCSAVEEVEPDDIPF